MDWTQLDWPALDRLRDGFLSGSASSGPYWRSLSDLANYDLTFGARIGWKWDAVLHELHRRHWRPPTRTVTDWGCGSGIAGRRLLKAFGAGNFDTLKVWDHSSFAREFAAAAVRRRFPSITVSELAYPASDETSPIGTLVLSHVLNELSSDVRADLIALARRADAIIWVEPGTHAVSRDLIALREQLCPDFEVIAPCTHQAACGLLTPGNERHWCHYFAPPPTGIYADPDWVKFGQRAGVDLRSLPYCFLVLERKPARPPAHPLPAGAARLIGRARLHKAHADLLSCADDGVTELQLLKRADPALFKKLDRDPPVPLYRWTRDGARILHAESLTPNETIE